ncbi:hypothetical protein F5Y08DRAFT_305704, partial [Xylaria arbuscula]
MRRCGVNGLILRASFSSSLASQSLHLTLRHADYVYTYSYLYIHSHFHSAQLHKSYSPYLLPLHSLHTSCRCTVCDLVYRYTNS